jgi:hypothetical protein
VRRRSSKSSASSSKTSFRRARGWMSGGNMRAPPVKDTLRLGTAEGSDHSAFGWSNNNQ